MISEMMRHGKHKEACRSKGSDGGTAVTSRRGSDGTIAVQLWFGSDTCYSYTYGGIFVAAISFFRRIALTSSIAYLPNRMHNVVRWS
jgi:hypothetical protein